MSRLFALSSVVLTLSACSSPSPAPATINLQLPISVSAAAVDSKSSIEVSAKGGLRTEAKPLNFDLHAVTLTAHTGEHPRLDQLVVPLGDANVAADALPPNGLQLRDLSLHIADPVALEVVHVEAQAIELRAHTALMLSWSMVLADGKVYKLGDVPTAPLDLDVVVTDDGIAPLTTISAHCAGSCWVLGGVGELRDASLYLEAAASVVPLR